jgi:Mg2+ and Co2+ transporter CorA
MQTQIKKLDNLIWINIVNPELIPLKKILVENGISESLAEEIVSPTTNAKVDTLRNSIYFTLHFPFTKGGSKVESELDVVIKSNLVITSTYDETDIIKNYLNKLTTEYNSHGGIYFTNFLKYVYGNLEDQVDNTASEILNIEKNILQTLLSEFSELKKNK